MKRRRFKLTSDQIELLLAFSECDSLAKLASVMAKDASVVSRNLQRLAETAPVLIKSSGRWHLSPLGRQICSRADVFIAELDGLITQSGSAQLPESRFSRAALVIINAQRGLLDPTYGGRSTPEAEDNILELLSAFRSIGHRVFHVRHVSSNMASPFYAASAGVEVLQSLAPHRGESIFDKNGSSAFTDTPLAAEIERAGLDALILVGFTANECIDATARHAVERALDVFVVSDATASFELKGPDGNLHKADRVHNLTLANLNAFVAEVVDTDEILKRLR